MAAGGVPIGSARPAWRPMPVKPSTTVPSKGVTVFGTTLTRRQTVIATAILLVAVIVLAVVIPKALGSGGEDKPTKGAVAPIASASAEPSVTTTIPAAPATTVPTTAAPTKAAPPSPPASGNTAVVLPSGWHIYADKATGFKVPVPASWSVSKKSTETYFTEQGGQHRLMIVDQTDTPALDPVADWTGKEAVRRNTYIDYHGISIAEVNYWDNAADWEYTRTSENGNPLHVVKRGFITAKNQAYGITWSTSEKDWAANKANLQLIYQGFIPRVS